MDGGTDGHKHRLHSGPPLQVKFVSFSYECVDFLLVLFFPHMGYDIKPN